MISSLSSHHAKSTNSDEANLVGDFLKIVDIFGANSSPKELIENTSVQHKDVSAENIGKLIDEGRENHDDVPAMEGANPNNFPDFSAMEGKAVVAFLKKRDLLRFEGPGADKLEAVFIKNIDSSNFFKSSVTYAFYEQHQTMTFSRDPEKAIDGAAAYAGREGVRNLIWVGGDELVRQDLIAHEFFHAALGTKDGERVDTSGSYGDFPGSNQIAEAAFAEEAGLDHGEFDLYRNGNIKQSSRMNIDFDKFMENKNSDYYSNDGTKEFDYEKFVKESGNYKSLDTEEDYDGRLNDLTSIIKDGVKGRTTLYIAGNLADKYRDLVSYQLSKHPHMSAEQANNNARKDLLDRLGNFRDEADVFRGYLERFEGYDHMMAVANDAYAEFNYNKLNKEQWA